MATSTEAKIARALMLRIGSLTLSPALPVAWPNLDFTKPADGKYLRVTFVPNVTQREAIGSDEPHRYMGLLQVAVHWPPNRGDLEPREIAGSIIAHFPCDLRLVEDDVEVRIMKRPEAADLLVKDAGVMIPVTIEYEAYA